METLRETLARLLHVRFGGIPPELQRRIDAAAGADLERWIERVVTAAALDAVFADA